MTVNSSLEIKIKHEYLVLNGSYFISLWGQLMGTFFEFGIQEFKIENRVLHLIDFWL
jgi:hypothetical protein